MPQILDKLTDQRWRGAARCGQVASAGSHGRQHRRLRADHQHAGQGQGDRGPLAPLRPPAVLAQPRQPGRGRGRRRPGGGGEGGLSRPLAPLLQAQGAVVRAPTRCRLLGPQRAAARRRRPHRSLERGRGDRARRLRRLLAGPRRAGPPLLRSSLDRCAGAAGQGAGRLRASHRAVGASLCAAELSGQAARRDDPGPRAGPRRASGAGRAAGPADGRHAADAGRDRLGVRRDADLPGAAEDRARRRCWPARSRTC